MLDSYNTFRKISNLKRACRNIKDIEKLRRANTQCSGPGGLRERSPPPENARRTQAVFSTRGRAATQRERSVPENAGKGGMGVGRGLDGSA